MILDDDLTPQWPEGPKGLSFVILKLEISHAVNVAMQALVQCLEVLNLISKESKTHIR
jgi:hypothetical protein